MCEIIVVIAVLLHCQIGRRDYMALSDCEVLGHSVGVAMSDVIFNSRTLDYMTPTACDGEENSDETYNYIY